MRAAVFTFATAMVLSLPNAASAQDTERYRLERAEGGFVRMDKHTGQMSFCAERSGQLVCKSVADERAAYADQLDEMATKIGELENRVAALEGRPSAGPNAGLPSEEEFEQTMSFMERFFRRFMGVAKDLEKEFGTAEPQPNKT